MVGRGFSTGIVFTTGFGFSTGLGFSTGFGFSVTLGGGGGMAGDVLSDVLSTDSGTAVPTAGSAPKTIEG